MLVAQILLTVQQLGQGQRYLCGYSSTSPKYIVIYVQCGYFMDDRWNQWPFRL